MVNKKFNLSYQDVIDIIYKAVNAPLEETDKDGYKRFNIPRKYDYSKDNSDPHYSIFFYVLSDSNLPYIYISLQKSCVDIEVASIKIIENMSIVADTYEDIVAKIEAKMEEACKMVIDLIKNEES